jgi:hypothetical protein
MSEFCETRCPAYLECTDRLASALDEGRILDGQQQAWSESLSTLPEAVIGAELAVTEREFDAAYQGLAAEVDGNTPAPLAEVVPSAATLANKALQRAEAERDWLASRFGVSEKVLAENSRRQEQNTSDVVAALEGVDAARAAQKDCPGPQLDLIGKLKVFGDRQTGSPALPELHLLDHARCASRAGRAALEATPVPVRQYVPENTIGRTVDLQA